MPARKKRKRAIAAVYVATEFCVLRQTSKLIARELYRDKRQCVAIENGKNLTKMVETKKVYVATRFFSRMSTPGRICRDKEAPVATNETGKRQKLCCDKGSFVTRQIIAT